MSHVKLVLVFGSGVTDVVAAKSYRPYGERTLLSIFEEIHRKAPKHQRPGSKKYSHFNIYPHCFCDVVRGDLTEKLRRDLSERVLVALLDCDVFEDAHDEVAIHKVLEIYQSSEINKNIYVIGRTQSCAQDFAAAIAADDEVLLIGMLIIDLQEDRTPRREKVVMELLATHAKRSVLH